MPASATYGSKTESVCDSRLVLGSLATLLSNVERDTGSFEGAQRLARYMINPQHYLTDVLTRCARGWPIGRPHEFMPKVWPPETPEIGVPAVREYGFTH